jgi:hypothetical protein
LPDSAVREARDRVRAAVKNSGVSFPLQRITTNLAPADIKKEGSGFDLAIALGVLLASDIFILTWGISPRVSSFLGETSTSFMKFTLSIKPLKNRFFSGIDQSKNTAVIAMGELGSQYVGWSKHYKRITYQDRNAILPKSAHHIIRIHLHGDPDKRAAEVDECRSKGMGL